MRKPGISTQSASKGAYRSHSRRRVAVRKKFNCDCAFQMLRLTSRIVRQSPQYVHVAGECRMYAKRVARLILRCKRNVALARCAHNATPASRTSARKHDSPPNGELKRLINVKPRVSFVGAATAQYIKRLRNCIRAREQISIIFQAPPSKSDRFAGPGFRVPPRKKLKPIFCPISAAKNLKTRDRKLVPRLCG